MGNKYLVNNPLYQAVGEDEAAYGGLMSYKLRVPAQNKSIDMFDPQTEDLSIEYMALCLGRIARYNGGTFKRISVAEHCLHTAKLAQLDGASDEIQLACLLSEASRAYIGSMTSAIEELMIVELNWFTNLKEVWDYAIMSMVKIKYSPSVEQTVKQYDVMACEQELVHDAYMWETGSKGPFCGFITHMDEDKASNTWLTAVTKLSASVQKAINKLANEAITAGLKEVNND